MIEIAKIDPGERAGRNMGDLDQLMADITANGLQHPITVSSTERLVLGARRLEACRRLGWRRIDAVTVTKVQEALDRIREDAVDARCTYPLTVEEMVYVDYAIRELEWWVRDGSAKKATQVRGRRDDRQAQMARLLGFNGRQYYQARRLVLAKRGYREVDRIRLPVSAEDRERATAALAAVQTPADLGAAWRMYQGEDVPLAAAPLRGPRNLPSRNQTVAIGSALSTLSGITTGLSQAMPLPPGLPVDVAAQWEGDVSKSIKVLLKLRRELRRNGRDDDRA